MKKLLLRYTLTVEVQVPDTFPVSADDVQRVADWKSNECSDGRHPFSTELMHDGAIRAAQWAVSESIFHHYCDRIDKLYGRANDHMNARNALVARCEQGVRFFRVHHEMGIQVQLQPEEV